ncbi:Hypothetical_protein [Hexamita inflata]|uniref:Hypothetical_protein n=1 Tax=Hexamita inflata TaxID=28002 RepID=A0AA86TWU1_9EUKA|nr:Hypothetical protein HINF_LOCUS11868 [Hexamita inflata]
MAKGMPSTSLQDWKAATASLLPQKRGWYDASEYPYRSACTKQPRMLVHESLVALAAEVRLTYKGVSKTNDHSRGLTVSYTEDGSINESQVSGIYIQFRIQQLNHDVFMIQRDKILLYQ